MMLGEIYHALCERGYKMNENQILSKLFKIASWKTFQTFDEKEMVL